MPNGVNRLSNPTFSRGRTNPQGWVWSTIEARAAWKKIAAAAPDVQGGVEIASERLEGEAMWTQSVRCSPGTFYRVEATVTCELEADPDGALDDGGFVVTIQPVIDDAAQGDRRVTPGVTRASKPASIRAYFEAPDGVRRVLVGVGVRHARGAAVVHEVRFIEVLEPEEESHILAVPPPPHALPAPHRVKTVCVCSATATDRPLTKLLTTYFGKSRVRTLDPSELGKAIPQTDALLLPDGVPPSSLRSLTALTKLAGERTVVISLPAFAKLSGGKLKVRRIAQEDDPIHARVVFANHATRGFALSDGFAYAWRGETPDGFVQNQFRKTTELKALCKKHGLITMLDSLCDRDATSEQPICFYKETPGGGLFVLDIDPVEAASTTYGEATIAMHWLLSVLGQTQSALGQYVSPVRKEFHFRDHLREMATRFAPFGVHEPDLPFDEIREQLVTIGRDDASFGLPLKAKPVILVRSGLSTGDAQSSYAALLWFKQLIRMVPHACPYAETLASRFRLAWVPLVAEWETLDGWRRTDRAPASATAIDVDDGGLAALIDIVSRPLNGPRVVMASDDSQYERYAHWIPQLAAAFPAGDYFTFRAADGAAAGNLDSFDWRRGADEITVVQDASAFEGDPYCDVLAAGGTVIRLELPSCDHDFTARSIERTDVGVTLLEHVIGLQYGLLAVNRKLTAATLDGFPPLRTGETLVVEEADPMLSPNASRAG